MLFSLRGFKAKQKSTQASEFKVKRNANWNEGISCFTFKNNENSKPGRIPAPPVRGKAVVVFRFLGSKRELLFLQNCPAPLVPTPELISIEVQLVG